MRTVPIESEKNVLPTMPQVNGEPEELVRPSQEVVRVDTTARFTSSHAFSACADVSVLVSEDVARRAAKQALLE